MTGIFTDEILSEMIRIAEQEKSVSDAPGLKIDESQFSLIPDTYEDGISLASLPLTQNIFVAAESDGLDKDLLKEKKKATDFDDIIEQAHPETAYMADGPNGTGVVENQNEQRTKILNVIYKTPTGFHFNTMADLVSSLTKIADTLEKKGDNEAVKRVDATLAAIQADLKKKVVAEPALLMPPKPPAGLLGPRPDNKKLGPSKPPAGALPPANTPSVKGLNPGRSPAGLLPDGKAPHKPAKPLVPDEVLPAEKPLAKQHGVPAGKSPVSTSPSKSLPGSTDAPAAKPGSAPGPINPSSKSQNLFPEPPQQGPKQRGRAVPPSSGEVFHQPGATKPKGKGVGGKVMGLIKGVGSSLKGKGKVGLIAGALGAGAYLLSELWDGIKSEWDKNIEIAQEEASGTDDAELRAIVDALSSVGDRVEGILSVASRTNELTPEKLEEIGTLVNLANDLVFAVPDDQTKLKQAAMNLQRLAMEFDRQGKHYVDRLLRREGLEAEADSERIASMQQWFKDNGQDIEVTGEADPLLKRHLQLFVSNMKKRFGPKFRPKNLTPENLLRHGNYELLDQLSQVWQYPHAAIGESVL